MTHLLNVEDAEEEEEEEEEEKMRKCGTHVRIKYFQLYIKKHTNSYMHYLTKLVLLLFREFFFV